MDDTTEKPQRTLRSDEPFVLFGKVRHLDEMVKLRPREGETGMSFLSRLRSSTTPEEAVTYTAFAALPGTATGWGYECLRMMADHLNPNEREMMERIAGWLAEPTMRGRQDIMRDALWAPTRSPSVLLALAVGWSAGHVAPNEPEPTPMHKAPIAINSAVLSCLARAPLSERSVRLARILDLAETLFRAY